MAKTKVDQAFAQTLCADPLELKTGDFLFEWCCDCHLRHILFYEIVRGKESVNDFVRIHSIRDSVGTELRRHYLRSRKKEKVKK